MIKQRLTIAITAAIVLMSQTPTLAAQTAVKEIVNTTNEKHFNEKNKTNLFLMEDITEESIQELKEYLSEEHGSYIISISKSAKNMILPSEIVQILCEKDKPVSIDVYDEDAEDDIGTYGFSFLNTTETSSEVNDLDLNVDVEIENGTLDATFYTIGDVGTALRWNIFTGYENTTFKNDEISETTDSDGVLSIDFENLQDLHLEVASTDSTENISNTTDLAPERKDAPIKPILLLLCAFGALAGIGFYRKTKKEK